MLNKSKQSDTRSTKQPLVDVNELCSQLTVIYGNPAIVEERYAGEVYTYTIFTKDQFTISLLMKYMIGRDYTVMTTNLTVRKDLDNGAFSSIQLQPDDLRTSCEDIVDGVSGWIAANA